jgi:hypothetical protein|tara:strand:- start:166 stop:510 length:345 start_codon:yes stop_codon:yes gene_type:complete
MIINKNTETTLSLKKKLEEDNKQHLFTKKSINYFLISALFTITLDTIVPPKNDNDICILLEPFGTTMMGGFIKRPNNGENLSFLTSTYFGALTGKILSKVGNNYEIISIIQNYL